MRVYMSVTQVLWHLCLPLTNCTRTYAHFYTIRFTTVSIVSGLLAHGLFPINCISIFAASRAFYSIENAGRLYPPSAYYLADVLVEFILNITNGALCGLTKHRNEQFDVFFKPKQPYRALLGHMGFVALVNLTTNVRTFVVYIDFVTSSPSISIFFHDLSPTGPKWILRNGGTLL